MNAALGAARKPAPPAPGGAARTDPLAGLKPRLEVKNLNF